MVPVVRTYSTSSSSSSSSTRTSTGTVLYGMAKSGEADSHCGLYMDGGSSHCGFNHCVVLSKTTVLARSSTGTTYYIDLARSRTRV